MRYLHVKPSSRATERSAAIYHQKIDCFVVNTPRNDAYANENGGVFFYIILAIVLLAGLTYVVSQNNRGNTAILTDEQARVAATEIIDYGTAVANAVQKLKLRGFKDTEISFGNNMYVDGSSTPFNAPGHNANCTLSNCEIFSIQGGGLSPITFTNSSTKDSPQAGNIQFISIDVSEIGSAERELVLKLYRIKPEVCGKINRVLGISSLDYLSPIDNHNQAVYNGSYPAPTSEIGDEATLFSGKTAFCLTTSSGYYHFYQVLIAR
jgi:hypothetical protein